MSPFRLAVALLLFVALGSAVSFAGTDGWNRAVTVWLQRPAPVPDLPSAILVFLGDAEIMIPVVALAGLALLRRDPRRGRWFLWIAAGLAATSALAFALKHVIPQPGPPPELQRHLARPGVGIPSPFSFPSGHTMRTTFFAGTLLRPTPLLAGVLVALMMAALVYLGDHWATDVLGGLCLGWVCVEAARRVLARPG